MVLLPVKTCSKWQMLAYKMHKCLECQKLFGCAGAVKEHMVTHSKEKAHACVDAISHLEKLNI